jgi:hypothetical protein
MCKFGMKLAGPVNGLAWSPTRKASAGYDDGCLSIRQDFWDLNMTTPRVGANRRGVLVGNATSGRKLRKERSARRVSCSRFDFERR